MREAILLNEAAGEKKRQFSRRGTMKKKDGSITTTTLCQWQKTVHKREIQTLLLQGARLTFIKRRKKRTWLASEILLGTERSHSSRKKKKLCKAWRWQEAELSEEDPSAT